MIPKIKRILYTTDLSENSAHVFRYALNSAQKHDATIIILYVLEPLSPTTRSLIESYLSDEGKEIILENREDWTMTYIKERLKVFCEREFKDSPGCTDRVSSIEVCVGLPVQLIPQKAEELNCDAIIMGTHSKGFIAKTILGSTVKKVLRRTRKPVFIIPLPKGEMDITYHGLQKVG